MIKLHKGVTITNIRIDNDGTVHIFANTGDEVKVTRAQRNEITDYKTPDFVKRVSKAFSNDKILATSFTYEVNGKLIELD